MVAKKHGNVWRCLVFDGYDENGKQQTKIITASTKKMAEFKAAEYKIGKRNAMSEKIAFEKALNDYIQDRSNVLSASSIRGYNQMRTYYESIRTISVSQFDTKMLQKWVNKFAENHSPKTVKNAYGLIVSVIRQYNPSASFQVKLPKRQPKTYTIPSDEQIAVILSYFREHDRNMYLAVLLASNGTLRRSEICALTADDIDGCTVHVHKALVQNEKREWIIKDTKTVQSDRYITFPQSIIDELPESGRIVSCDPDYITRTFNRTLKRLGLPSMPFHNLRHFAVSYMHSIGIPDRYIQERGGFSGTTVMQSIYRNSMTEYSQKYTDVMNASYDAMIKNLTKNLTKNEKNP